MRKHWSLAQVYAEAGDFSGFIELAIEEFQKESDMSGPWRACGLI